MKYPKAGDLQRATATQLTSNPCNPCAHQNPWEVRSDSGLEGVFADEDLANAEADDLRRAGAQGVTVGPREKATRPRPPRHALRNPSRLFTGVYPTGIVYADKDRERDGDYLRVAFLPFATLRLQWSPGSHPDELREMIQRDAEEIMARRGQPFEVSASGQTVILGGSQQRPAGAPPQYHTPQGRPPGVPNHGNPPRVTREKYGDDSEIVIEHNRYGYTGWLESKRGGGRLPISFGATRPESAADAIRLAKKFLASVHGKNNPAGLTAKQERMYEHIKASYGADPRAAEIAARTVYAHSNPPSVLPVPGQQIRSWDHGDGRLVKICEESNDGKYSATIKLANGQSVTVPLTRTEYDFTPRKVLERRTGYSRHEEFLGPPQPDRLPRGTPMEFDDTAIESDTAVENPARKLGDKYILGTWAPGSIVQLGEWTFPSWRPAGFFMPGEWVTVVRNGASVGHTVTVKLRTGGTVERDALAPLFEVDPLRSTRA